MKVHFEANSVDKQLLQHKPVFGYSFSSEPKPQSSTMKPQVNCSLKAKELVFLEEVNDFQTELYNFKMKSKQIQSNIQRDIDSINQNMAFSLLGEARLQKEFSIADLKTALLILKQELDVVRGVIAEIRKRSEYTDEMSNMSSGLARLPQFFLNTQLELLNKSLFRKILQIKTAKAQLREHFDCERRLRVKVSQALAKSHNVNAELPGLLPNYKRAPTPASSLAELISEMNGMINQLSAVSVRSPTTKVPTSKPAPSSTDKPTPTTFETKPANMQSDTIQAKTNESNNNTMTNVFETKPVTANNLGCFGFSNPIFEPPPLFKPTHTSAQEQEKQPTFVFKPPVNSEGKKVNKPKTNFFEINRQIDNLSEANKPMPNLFEANKPKDNFFETNKPKDNFFEIKKPIDNFFEVKKPIDNFFEVNKPKANIFEANKPMTNFFEVNKPKANLSEVNKPIASIFEENKPKPNLFEANKPTANLVETNKPIDNFFEVNKPMPNLFEANKPKDNFFETNKPKDNFFEVKKPIDNFFEVKKPLDNFFEVNKPNATLFEINKSTNNLSEVNKPMANFFEVNKPKANIFEANKPMTNFFEVNKPKANLSEVNKPKASIFEANKPKPNLFEANKPTANLVETNKPMANFFEVNKPKPNLFVVNKPIANFFEVNKPRANFFERNPTAANKTQFTPTPAPSTVPKSKWPPFEFKPANIPSETSQSKTSDPVNNPINLFGTIPKAANNSSPHNLSEPTQGFQPLFKPSFDFKPVNVKGVTINSKSSEPIKTPMSNLFGTKTSTANTSYPLNWPASSQSSAPSKFEYPSPKPTPIFVNTSFQFKPENIDSSTKNQPKASDQVNNPMRNIFGCNPRVADNSSPKSASGTTDVNFQPLDIRYSDITERHQCITCMNEYSNKSLEELRLEDYRNKGLDARTSSVFYFASTPFKQQTSKDSPSATFPATTRVKFVPYIGPDVHLPASADVKYQCITFMKEYEGKSLEEIRLEDYILPKVEKIRRKLQPYLAKSKGTTSVKWDPPVESEFIVQDGVSKIINIRYQCISCMKKYEHKSLEELRHEDYRKGLIPGLFGFQQQPRNEAASTTSIPTESTQATVFETSTQNDHTADSKSSTQGCKTSNYFVSYFLNSSKQKSQVPETSTQSSRVSDREAKQQFNTPTQKSQTPLETAQNSPASDREAKQQCNTSTRRSQAPETSTQSNPVSDREAKQQCNTPTLKSQTPFETTRNSPVSDREVKHQCNTPTQRSQAPETSTLSSPASDREATQQCTQRSQTPLETSTLSSRTSNCEAKQQCNTPTQKSQTPLKTAQRSQTSERETSTQGSNATRTTQTLAEEKKEAGDRLCNQEKYEEAVEMFTEAIKLCSENPVYYTSRAATLVKLRRHRKALEDMQKAVAIDPMSTPSYISIAKCCLILGNIVTGEQAVRRATELSGADCVRCERDAFADLRRKQETALKLMNLNNFYDALTCVNLCLTYSPSCTKTKLMKAECLAMLKRFQEAQDIAINISLFESSDADSFYVLGLCSFYQDKEEQAIKHFKKVLDLARDHKKAQAMHKKAKQIRNDKLLKRKREQGNEAFNKGNWQEALDLYNEALKIDQNNKEENAKLHYNKATVYAKQNEIMKSAQACTEALELDGNYVKALLRRAQCYTELEDHEEAVEDYEKLGQINPSKENKRLLDEANKAMKKYKKSNFYYKILGIVKTATEDDIKKAYRTCARLYHPDRHRDAGNAVIRVMERKFKQVGEANTVLSDPTKRAQYDRYQHDDDDDYEYRSNRYNPRYGDDYYDDEDDDDDNYSSYYY